MLPGDLFLLHVAAFVFSHIAAETHLFLCPCSLDDDFGFSPWSSWSPCSQTCTTTGSPAVKSRQRLCGTPPCSGGSHQEKACNLLQCPGVNVDVLCRVNVTNWGYLGGGRLGRGSSSGSPINNERAVTGMEDMIYRSKDEANSDHQNIPMAPRALLGGGAKEGVERQREQRGKWELRGCYLATAAKPWACLL